MTGRGEQLREEFRAGVDKRMAELTGRPQDAAEPLAAGEWTPAGAGLQIRLEDQR